tara:strand:+ start:304 stop:726 length:423 start_codon:yes stop_codon:yes gene_type:complete
MKYAVPLALAVLVGFAGMNMLRGGVAPTPEVFATGSSLAQGMEKANAAGKPVLAVVTADWCPPCQQLKRGALADPEVAAWIDANTVPVYINSDESPDDAAALKVRALPTTVLLRDGEIIASRTGAASPADYLAFLKDAAD